MNADVNKCVLAGGAGFAVRVGVGGVTGGSLLRLAPRTSAPGLAKRAMQQRAKSGKKRFDGPTPTPTTYISKITSLKRRYWLFGAVACGRAVKVWSGWSQNGYG